MKHFLILPLLILMLASCENLLDTIYGYGTGSLPGPNPETVTPSGGSCVSYSPIEAGLTNQIDMTFNGSQMTLIKNAIPSNGDVEAGADMAALSSVDGKSYFELTYDASSGIGPGSFIGIVIATPDRINVLQVQIAPTHNFIQIVKEINGVQVYTQPITGATFNFGYVIGAQLDHDTGDIRIKDSLGNSMLVLNFPELTNTQLLIGIVGMPGYDDLDSMTGTLNVGDSLYSLNPFPGSQDWCGNPL